MEKRFLTSGPGAKQKVQVGMWIHRRLRSACASSQSDQSLMGALWFAKCLMFLKADN